MSSYKTKEVFDYLTRKPVTTQDIELARTRFQPLATRIEQPETDYQTEVQPDMVVPPQDVLPKNPEPVMPSAPGIPDPQFRQIELAEGGRAEFADGTRLSFEEKQKTLRDIKKYVDKKLSKKEIVTLSELNEKFGQGQRREYLYREALGKDYNKITKLQREGVGRVSLEVKDKLYSIIDEVVKGKRPLMDLSRNNLNKELPPVSERQLSKYLNENNKYKNFELASNVDKVQQRIAKGNEKLKDATLKNIESKLEQTTANLRRPSPKRIEEFIVRDLVRHDNQGGELFKVLPKSNTKFYDKIKILDVANDDILTVKKIKDFVDMGDPRFKEYKETFNEIKQLKKTPYINPVTKEETNLLNALQQATGNKQPLNIDHLEGVKNNPLNKLAVSTYKANTGANIKDITEEELNILGRKKFTPEQNIERLTKFTDRRLLKEAASGFEKVKTPLETLAVKKSNVLFSDPIGIGNFLETSLGQTLSKSTPNLLRATAKLSTVTGTPLNALLGVAINAEENKEIGLSDLETIAAGAYKGSTQDLLNFGDLIFRKLPVATYEKFVQDKPFLESLLNKPEYFEFADRQINKYASEKSIKDRIENRAEYEVRKSIPINISDTEVPTTMTSKEFNDLKETKKNEILNANPNLKQLYEGEVIQQPKPVTPQQSMLGPIVFPKYTQEELNLAKGGRVKFASGSDDPESDLYIPPLDKSPETNLSKEGIDGLYFGTRQEQRPIPVDPMTGKPISSGGMRELKQVFSSLLSDTRPEAGYRKGNIDFYASKGINPFQGDTDFKYGASYTPEGNVGKFLIDKTPQYLGAGYTYQKDGLDLGITGLKDQMGDKSITLRFGYKYAKGGIVKND
jgi:bifunctional DNA-binding transcriptional regulator/antitoxin component of YhaV-PrlF toxin-antitoxin module